MSEGRPRNPGQLICPRTGRVCLHHEPPPACRHYLDYEEPYQDDTLLLVGVLLQQQREIARRQALLAVPSSAPTAVELLRATAAGTKAIEPMAMRALVQRQERRI
jgi:hypothetical protein